MERRRPARFFRQAWACNFNPRRSTPFSPPSLPPSLPPPNTPPATLPPSPHPLFPFSQAGDGNWAFELYANNRSNSFVRNGSLHIHTTLSNATFDVANADVNLWGGDPATACTDNGFFGCERTGGAGGNIVNPITSARVRTAETFAFKYGRVEVVAKLPLGDWSVTRPGGRPPFPPPPPHPPPPAPPMPPIHPTPPPPYTPPLDCAGCGPPSG